MPITPFHLGPGILVKACAPRSVSLTAFAVSQALIDIEPGYHLLRRGWPLHREMHSLLLAGLVGLLAGIAVGLIGRRLPLFRTAIARSELALRPALLGGVLGGLSHPLIDAVMHLDVQPFWPLSSANSLFACIGLRYLHMLCVAAGIAGLAILAVRGRLASTDGRRENAVRSHGRDG